MTENEQINKLDLHNVQLDNIFDLGTDVVDALREVLGEDALRSLYEESKGKGRVSCKRSSVPMCS